MNKSGVTCMRDGLTERIHWAIQVCELVDCGCVEMERGKHLSAAKPRKYVGPPHGLTTVSLSDETMI